MTSTRHPSLLHADTTALLIIDVQPRLSRFVPAREQVIATTIRLARLAEIYGLPIGLTEQNVDKFGATETPIIEAVAHQLVRPPLDKLEFSACASDSARDLVLTALDRPQIVIVGMETHICILQSALDLLHAGRQVHVVSDGVGARSKGAHKNGLRRMADAGVILTNWESVCYEVAYKAGDDRFRRMLNEVMKAEVAVPALA